MERGLLKRQQPRKSAVNRCAASTLLLRDYTAFPKPRAQVRFLSGASRTPVLRSKLPALCGQGVKKPADGHTSSMSSEHEDADTVGRSLAISRSVEGATGDVVHQAFARLLSSDVHVTTAAEGKRLLAEDDDAEQMTDAIQRFVGIATPVARIALRGARFTRIPWVLVASSSVSIGVTVRSGVRELRVLAALLTHRLKEETGEQPDVGGAAAASTMLVDRRIRAGADLDGLLFGQVRTSGLSRPFLLMNAEPGFAAEPNRAGFWTTLRGPRYAVDVKGAQHFAFSDLAFFVPMLMRTNPAAGEALRQQVGKVDGLATLAAERAYISAFFGRFLRGKPQPLLAKTPGPFAGVHLTVGR